MWYLVTVGCYRFAAKFSIVIDPSRPQYLAAFTRHIYESDSAKQSQTLLIRLSTSGLAWCGFPSIKLFFFSLQPIGIGMINTIPICSGKGKLLDSPHNRFSSSLNTQYLITQSLFFQASLRVILGLGTGVIARVMGDIKLTSPRPPRY